MKKHLLIIILLISSGDSYSKSEPIINTTTLRDIDFWTNQFKEHAEFAADFTNNEQLKNKSIQLQDKITQIQNRTIPNKSSLQQEFIGLADQMEKYQNEVMSYLKKNSKDPKKEYGLQLALLDHMNQETDYARKKASGKKFTPEQEAKFWSTEHKGQAEVMTTLIKANVPGGASLKVEAANVMKELEDNIGYFTSSDINTVEQANQELDAIGKQLDKDPKKSSISAKLAKHEERERAYAQTIFEHIQK